MTSSQSKSDGEPRIGKTLLDDVRRGDFSRVIRRDYRELKEIMLTEERQKRLGEMSRFRRWFWSSWWLLKALILKLTPARRILLLVGIVLILMSRTVVWRDRDVRVQFDTTAFGATVILFVLMLELKDKLLARKELEAGRAVQTALTPERTPLVPGWGIWLFARSANEVGGDLVDFAKLSENRFGIAVGDVAGKGLRAALLSVKLQASLRALAPDFLSLDELAAKLNEIFCRDSLPNLFASIFYLELQPDSGVVRTVNAGHIPPLLIRSAQIHRLEKGGVALGILPGATFAEQRIELQSGDMLVVYSDGLTEARNDEGTFFGEQRFADLVPTLASLPAESVGEQIITQIDRFVGEARPNDDISIAILKRQ
ncbi:MAG: serine/threonine-protein phosphatase [Ignavibacteria bacterium]|nr:serine/threonine-protein phosphatase [Ignavibacteria bacterium]